MISEPNFYIYRAHIVDVHDGDTCTADIDLGFGIWMRRQKLRLYGINTPELRGERSVEGIAARDRVRELILNRDVIIETVHDRTEKYGRWLATVWVENKNVNLQLVLEGLAKPYMGVGEKP